jgi:glyoxylase-like metal-dependent hydrolase (beta-lactamase superfamily II)
VRTNHLSGKGDGGIMDLGRGVFLMPTDYPTVSNAPLWAYLVGNGDRFALIDPGVRTTLQATVAASVREIGFELHQADLVIATHGHPDHSGAQASWREVSPQIRVAAPIEEVPWVESFDRQWVRFWADYPGTLDWEAERASMAAMCLPEATVDMMLRDGDSLAVGGRSLTTIQTRGHTWGHCAYFDEESGHLFTGDAAQGRGARSSDDTSTFAPLYVDVSEARAGLKRLLSLPFSMLCPAHFLPMDRESGLSFLHESLGYIDDVEELARDVVERCGSRPLLTSELALRIGEMVGMKPPVAPHTVSTARAHLYALAREGALDAAWIARKSSGYPSVIR